MQGQQPKIWNALTTLRQLKLYVYSYFVYDNVNFPYGVAIT